ncbi:hypothetical protein ACFUN8_35835 [Streptomyces sp. NPDC057307]
MDGEFVQVCVICNPTKSVFGGNIWSADQYGAKGIQAHEDMHRAKGDLA